MEGVWRQGFRPLVAAQKPTNRASYQKREPRAAPNGNRENRFGPIWQIVHGVVPRHTDARPSCSRLDRLGSSRRGHRISRNAKEQFRAATINTG
jgi:hypothetical protein